MQFVAALIEYLISGLISFAWLAPLINIFVYPIIDLASNSALSALLPKEFIVLIFLPIAYVIGIFVDLFSSMLLNLIGFRSYRFSDTSPPGKAYKKTIAVITQAGDTNSLIRMMELYVSRHRIMRGVCLNALMTAVIWIFIGNVPVAAAAGIFMVLALVLERKTRKLSDTFKYHAKAGLTPPALPRPNRATSSAETGPSDSFD